MTNDQSNAKTAVHNYLSKLGRAGYVAAAQRAGGKHPGTFTSATAALAAKARWAKPGARDLMRERMEALNRARGRDGRMLRAVEMAKQATTATPKGGGAK